MANSKVNSDFEAKLSAQVVDGTRTLAHEALVSDFVRTAPNGRDCVWCIMYLKPRWDCPACHGTGKSVSYVP